MQHANCVSNRNYNRRANSTANESASETRERNQLPGRRVRSYYVTGYRLRCVGRHVESILSVASYRHGSRSSSRSRSAIWRAMADSTGVAVSGVRSTCCRGGRRGFQPVVSIIFRRMLRVCASPGGRCLPKQIGRAREALQPTQNHGPWWAVVGHRLRAKRPSFVACAHWHQSPDLFLLAPLFSPQDFRPFPLVFPILRPASR